MTQENKTQQKSKLSMYLIYAAIALLIINCILIFIPFVKIYQPSSSKTVLGVTTYEGWFIESASMAKFIFPLFFTLPHAFAIGSFRMKKEKSPFIKILKNKVDKPIRFIPLFLTSFANLISMLALFDYLKNEVSVYEKYGAYCHFTAAGVISVIFTIALILVLFVLSYLSTRMVATTNEAEEITNENVEVGDK